MVRVSIATTLLMASLSGVCLAEDVNTKTGLLKDFLSEHEWGSMGNKKAVWLMKYNSFDQWDEVAVIFGYMDNMSACEELNGGLRQAFPQQKYICQFVN